MVVGVVIGTYSSIFVASASLLYIRPKRKPGEDKEASLSEYERIERRHTEHQERLAVAPPKGLREMAGLQDEPPEAELEPEPEVPPSPAVPPAGRKRSSSLRDRRRRRGR
jgi:hypothetical protein